jgi:DNA polymerase III alpha subunit (gram-positive type)
VDYNMKVWIDLETTGLSPDENGVVQFAMIIEDDSGSIVHKYSTYMKPFFSCKYENTALEINELTVDEINNFRPEKEAVDEIVNSLKEYQDGNVQYEFCGYNSRFDMDFFVQLLKRNGHFYWNYFTYYDIDVFALVKILGLSSERFDEKKNKYVPSKKLEDICREFGIKIKAHDAISDIKATRKLFYKLKKRYLK